MAGISLAGGASASITRHAQRIRVLARHFPIYRSENEAILYAIATLLKRQNALIKYCPSTKTIADVDQIFVIMMDMLEITEHDELLKDSPIYQELLGAWVCG